MLKFEVSDTLTFKKEYTQYNRHLPQRMYSASRHKTCLSLFLMNMQIQTTVKNSTSEKAYFLLKSRNSDLGYEEEEPHSLLVGISSGS